MTQTANPTVIVERDYDGYFEALVRGLMTKTLYEHREIHINSGPYRPDALTYRIIGDAIYLDFYSALRNGFGHLSSQDLEGLRRLL